MSHSMLLTGATGTLGPHLLAEVLESEAVDCVLVIVRPGAHHDPIERLRDTIRRFAAGTGRPQLRLPEGRLVPIAGDVRRDDLGIDRELFNQVTREVDVVIHAAANTRFTAPYIDLYDANVLGTGRILRLASRCKGLRQLLLVSTTCVAGTRRGAIAERIEVEAPGFTNGYEQTKWQAEQLAAATDLPVRIARLSTCLGDGNTGFVHRFGAIHFALHWFMRGLIPMVPGTDGSCVDLIPTDLAARWLARAATRPVEHLEVCQVAAGSAAIPLAELLAFVVQHLRARDPGWERRQIEMPVVVDADTFTAFERTAIQSGNPLFRRVLESVNSFLPALLHPKVYETHHAEACWGGALPLGDWRLTLGRVIDYALDQGRPSRGRAEVTCA